MFEFGIVEAIFIFAFGAAIGSFINVIVCRLPNKISIVKPASYCPYCKSRIAIYDNIPIISFIILGGRCRKCKARISPRYLFIELFMGTTYLFTALFFHHNLLLAAEILLLLPPFVSITIIDIEHYIIPDHLSIWIGIVGMVFSYFIQGWNGILMSIAGATVGAIVMFAIAFGGKKFFKKEALGEGDIILAAALGTISGPLEILGVVFFASLLGSTAVLVIWIARKIKHMETELRIIPFGPFLCASELIMLIYGKEIWNFYLRLHGLL